MKKLPKSKPAKWSGKMWALKSASGKLLKMNSKKGISVFGTRSDAEFAFWTDHKHVSRVRVTIEEVR